MTFNLLRERTIGLQQMVNRLPPGGEPNGHTKQRSGGREKEEKDESLLSPSKSIRVSSLLNR